MVWVRRGRGGGRLPKIREGAGRWGGGTQAGANALCASQCPATTISASSSSAPAPSRLLLISLSPPHCRGSHHAGPQSHRRWGEGPNQVELGHKR